MGRIDPEVTVTKIDKQLWRLDKPLHYEAGDEGSEHWIVVPKDFVTDGASIPKFLQAIYKPEGLYFRAAIIHDYLVRCYRLGEPHFEASTPYAIDMRFAEAMLWMKVPKGIVQTFFYALRVFGWPEPNPRITGFYEYQRGSN